MRLSFIFFILLISFAGCAERCYIQADSRVDFYPTYVYRGTNGLWAMPVVAWVHETSPSSSMAQTIQKSLQLAVLIPGLGGESYALQQRLAPFLLRGTPGVKVPVAWEQTTVRLIKSDADGFVRGEVIVPTPAPEISYFKLEVVSDAGLSIRSPTI